ncbi:MAG: AGE family epimerase/isomerase, partial [Clostridia bacterium]|nr:AGE family epimerase/isomerase [Clostridia bacterium]
HIENRSELEAFSEQVREHLLREVLGFWKDRTADVVNGGYITAFDRKGNQTDNEKNIWMQARQTWMFSKIYTMIDHDLQWLQLAKHGFDFLMDSMAYAGGGRWNYLLTADGKQVMAGTQSIYTDSFALMALCAYAEASGETGFYSIIKDTFDALDKNLRDENFSDCFPQIYQQGKAIHGLFMINIYAVSEAKGVLGNECTDPLIKYCMDQIFSVMLDKEHNFILELKHRDGSIVDDSAGYMLNPGHNFEGLWFIVREAKRMGMTDYYEQALKKIRNMWNLSHDTKYGGVLFMLDARGIVPGRCDWNEKRNLQWNEKVWWTHSEALCALLTCAAETQDQQLFGDFTELWDYCLQHFWDREFGEWYFVLHQDGTPRLTNKGGFQKAAFHIPRSLFHIYLLLKGMSEL